MAQQDGAATSSDTHRSLDWSQLGISSVNDILAAQTPSLCIRPKSFRGLRVQSSDRTFQSGGLPGWVPDPRLPRIKCSITCALYENEEVQSTQIAARTLPAMVVAVEKDGSQEFSCQMEPFQFPIDQIPFLRNGTSEQKFRVKFDIECDAPRDVEQLMQLLDENHNVRGQPAEGSHIYAAWTYLPRCPTRDELLPLHRGDGARYRKLASRLVMDMKWHLLSDTPMAVYYRAKYEAEGLLATNQERVDKAGSEDAHHITYAYTDAAGIYRAFTTTELFCPLCCRSHPHSSFDRLHSHFLLNHEHLQFAVKDGGRSGNTVYKTVQVDLAEKLTERAVHGVVDEKNMNWIRPARPFDLAAYLGGDYTWTSAREPPRKKIHETFTQAEPSLVVNARYKDPSAVGDIASKNRKRYTVPNIPGVTLYRNISKRRIEPGEVLSESDDDVDCSWLQVLQKRRKIDDISQSAEYMLKLFDAHMDEEDLNGDLYLSDALVRFCRRYKDQLVSAFLFEDFRAKLKQLRHSGLIPQETEIYCLDFLRSTNAPRQHTTSGAERLGPSTAHFLRHENSDAKDISGDVIMVDSDSDPDTPEDTEMSNDYSGEGYFGPFAQTPVARTLLETRYGSHKVFIDATLQVMAHNSQSQEDIFTFREQLARLAAKRSPQQPWTPVSIANSATPSGEAEDPITAFLKDKKFMRSTNGDANVLNTSQQVMVGRKAACECGSVVVGGRGAIVCASSGCRRGAFHMRCVGVQYRDPTWICPSCR
ncbi:hypothetical protein MBLNU457_7167t1 [Dothideomycetes sp. NU457]